MVDSRPYVEQADQRKREEGVSSQFINYINSYNFRPRGPNWKSIPQKLRLGQTKVIAVYVVDELAAHPLLTTALNCL